MSRLKRARDWNLKNKTIIATREHIKLYWHLSCIIFWPSQFECYPTYFHRVHSMPDFSSNWPSSLSQSWELVTGQIANYIQWYLILRQVKYQKKKHSKRKEDDWQELGLLHAHNNRWLIILDMILLRRPVKLSELYHSQLYSVLRLPLVVCCDLLVLCSIEMAS